MTERVSGTVKWFDNAKGYGFIVKDGHDDIFVHYKAIRGEGHRSLKDGQEVEFSITTGPKGLLAEDVSALAQASA